MTFISPVVLITCFFLQTLITSVYAQDGTELTAKKSNNDEKQLSFQQEFDNFTKYQQDSFNQFIEQRDQEFLQMLKQQWQEFEQMTPLVRDQKPKPDKVPRVVDVVESSFNQKPVPISKQPLLDKTKEVRATKNAFKVVKQKDVKSVKKLIPTSTVKQKSVLRPMDVIRIDFFGNELALEKTKFANIESINQQGLTQYWQDSTSIDLASLIDAFTQYKTSLELSDWAFISLVNKYAKKVTSTESNATALSWLLLNKTGYKAKVAFNEMALVLLIPSTQKVYGVHYYNLGGERFYLFSNDNKKQLLGSIVSYKGDYDVLGAMLDLRFTKTVNTIPAIKNKVIEFQLNERKQQLSLPYDYQRIAYFSDYPQIDLVHYFQAPLDAITELGLQQIKQQLMGDNEQKLNQLLAIIHQGFPYATDGQQFGKENYLLIEETLHYQASDCEDRAVLFAWLAKHLIDEQVVALNYPGHVSTGIEHNGEIISADPTYIGATIGQSMPEYINVKAQIIRF